MVVLIVAGDRTTPAAQDDCTLIVEQLRQVDWSKGAPRIHIVADADTGRWLLRSMTHETGGEIPLRALPSVERSAVESKAGWPFEERRRRTTDRRHDPDAHTHGGRRASELVAPQADDDGVCTPGHCTEREEQIVKLIRQGLTNKEIAQRLGIVEDTVKKHLQHIYDKLGVRRRTLVMLNWPRGPNGSAAAIP